MPLIAVKNPDLYRAWVNYLSGSGPDTAAIRTRAFFASERGDAVPLF